MASFLNLRETDYILDIGCGVGWSVAVFSKLCKTVYTMERFKKLLDIAKKNIAKLKIENVQFKLGNGFEGWGDGDKTKFDAINIGAYLGSCADKIIGKLKI